MALYLCLLNLLYKSQQKTFPGSMPQDQEGCLDLQVLEKNCRIHRFTRGRQRASSSPGSATVNAVIVGREGMRHPQ